jgi:prophage DNA circulation protein
LALSSTKYLVNLTVDGEMLANRGKHHLQPPDEERARVLDRAAAQLPASSDDAVRLGGKVKMLSIQD